MSLSTAVDASAVARVVGIKTEFKNLREGIAFLPMHIAVIGNGANTATYSTDKYRVTSAFEAGSLYGFGSPIHLAVSQLMPVNGDGVGSIPVTVFPLADGTTPATGTITPSGTVTTTATYYVDINGIRSAYFSVAAAATVAQRVAALAAAINAVADMPVLAVDTGGTICTLTSKWSGVSANDIDVKVVGDTTVGNVWTVVQPSGGAGNPTIDAALAQMGNVWYTLVLNCLDITDSAALNALQTTGEGRWGALVKKPFVAFTGEVASTVSAAITIPDARKTDRVNCQLVAPGSRTLPFVAAAAALARIAVVANNQPAHDYGRQQVFTTLPGADGDQWTYPQRDQAVKAGSSTIEVRDGVVNLADTVTFHHPSGDPLPAYRFVVDVVKLMNIIYNLELRFAVPAWDGAPLIPDDQPTVDRNAKKPKMAKAEICAVIDSLALNAIISDAKFAKDNTLVEIDASNPKRLNVSTTMKLSGNSNIISVDFLFGYYFGAGVIVG